jgi:hypothetical protein
VGSFGGNVPASEAETCGAPPCAAPPAPEPLPPGGMLPGAMPPVTGMPDSFVDPPAPVEGTPVGAAGALLPPAAAAPRNSGTANPSEPSSADEHATTPTTNAKVHAMCLGCKITSEPQSEPAWLPRVNRRNTR